VKFRPIQYLVGAMAAAALMCAVPSGALAQDDQPPPEHHHHVEESSTWTWSTDANVLAGYNYQDRRFADFWAWESQNWGMAMAERQLGAGRLTLNGMVSLEP
jgi:hypothetical protein